MSVDEIIDTITDSISEEVPIPESEYVGEDGFLHCSKCYAQTETVKNVFGKEKRLRCICDCRRKELEELEEKEKMEERERQRCICFSESNMRNWTFGNDDKHNEKISNAMKKYVENFREFKKDGRGLLLHGNVGTGKTYLAACIANALIDNNYTVLMTNFARVTNAIQGKFEGRQEYIDSLNRYSLLIIDDLGAERTTEYMQEMVFNIVDARYRSGLPLIITTNLSMEKIKNPDEIGYSRIYDRILERCFPVEVSGISVRKQNLKESFFDVKEKLGL